MDEAYKEDTSSIEVSFPVPVWISREHQHRLVQLIGDICTGFEARHPDRVMWAAGFGGKMLTNPMILEDDERLEFDMSVLNIEVCEREAYENERRICRPPRGEGR